MEVILLEKIENLGTLGDRVKVKPGYGRNYLLPQGKAAPATPENIAEFEARQPLDSVARWLRGVAIGGNLSLIDSEVDVPLAEQGSLASFGLDTETRRVRVQPGIVLDQLNARMGIPHTIAELREAVDFLRYYGAQACKHFGEPLLMPGPTGERNTYCLRGRGVFVCISPWNFPLAIFTGQVAAALAAGNAVVSKSISVGGRHVIPLCELCLAFGAGGGRGPAARRPARRRRARSRSGTGRAPWAPPGRASRRAGRRCAPGGRRTTARARA